MSVNSKYRKWRRKRKSFQRRLLEQLGIVLLTKEMAVIYLCIFYVVVTFYQPIINFCIHSSKSILISTVFSVAS
jgi:hypothetical protein